MTAAQPIYPLNPVPVSQRRRRRSPSRRANPNRRRGGRPRRTERRVEEEMRMTNEEYQNMMNGLRRSRAERVNQRRSRTIDLESPSLKKLRFRFQSNKRGNSRTTRSTNSKGRGRLRTIRENEDFSGAEIPAPRVLSFGDESLDQNLGSNLPSAADQSGCEEERANEEFKDEYNENIESDKEKIQKGNNFLLDSISQEKVQILKNNNGVTNSIEESRDHNDSNNFEIRPVSRSRSRSQDKRSPKEKHNQIDFTIAKKSPRTETTKEQSPNQK